MFSQWHETPRSHLALSWQLSKEARSCDVPVGSACASVLASSREAGYSSPPGTSVNKQKRAAPIKPFNRPRLTRTAGTAGQTRHSCTALVSPFHSGASCRTLRGAWTMLTQNEPCTELWGERTPWSSPIPSLLFCMSEHRPGKHEVKFPVNSILKPTSSPIPVTYLWGRPEAPRPDAVKQSGDHHRRAQLQARTFPLEAVIRAFLSGLQ